MPPLQIIKTGDINYNVCNTLTSGFIATIVNFFSFQTAEKSFRNRIIQAVALKAHAAFPAGRAGTGRWYTAPLNRYGTRLGLLAADY
jgi:hypothetical protein